MSILQTQDQTTQRGFTLVELAIVLVIIGLLLGGILKGQELIAATRVNTTASQIKSIEAAAYTFQDTYGGKPGDIVGADTRVTSCTAANGCAVPTGGTRDDNLGNGQVNGSVLDAMAVGSDGGSGTTEATAFFNQLYGANLIGGLTSGGATSLGIGTTVLGASLDSSAQWRIGYHTADLAGMAGTTENNSHYMALVAGGVGSAVTVAAATDTIPAGGGILPKQASAIDTKIDDGQPALGVVRGLGMTDGSATACSSTDTSAATYMSASTSKICGVAVKILQ